MRKISRRSVLVAAGAMVLLSTPLASCSSTDPASTSEAPASAGAATSSETEPADPFAPYEETLTVSIGKSVDPTASFAEGDDIYNNIHTRDIKDVLNIDFEYMWEVTSTDKVSKINLAIASNNIPDFMVVNESQFNTLVKMDMIEDLTDSYNKHSSPAMQAMFDSSAGVAMDSVTVDGEMLAIPSISVPDNSYNMYWVRQDWLDELGLEAPKTLDDLKAVAKAFVEKDPGNNGAGNTIGITGPASGGAMYSNFLASSVNFYALDAIFSAKDSYPGYWYTADNGDVTYGSVTQETRNALEELAQMYADGLIDPQMGVRSDSSEAVISGQAGIFLGPWWAGYTPIPMALDNNPEANWQAYTLEDDNGVVNSHMAVTSTEYLVCRKGYEHPEAAIKLLNLLIEKESVYDRTKASINEYPLRVPMAMYDETSFEREAVLDVLTGKKTADDFTKEDYKAYKLLQGDLEGVTKVKLEPYDDLNIENWDRAADPANFPRLYCLLVGAKPLVDVEFNEVYSLTYGLTETMETKWSNLKKLEDETFLKIVMGREPIEAFDAFVEQWTAEGGAEITQEVADNYT